MWDMLLQDAKRQPTPALRLLDGSAKIASREFSQRTESLDRDQPKGAEK
jgi:hypothetical protein